MRAVHPAELPLALFGIARWLVDLIALVSGELMRLSKECTSHEDDKEWVMKKGKAKKFCLMSMLTWLQWLNPTRHPFQCYSQASYDSTYALHVDISEDLPL